MSPKILVKFATRSRPDKFINCIENYQKLSTHDNYEIVVSADTDDPSMNNDYMKSLLEQYEHVKICFGNSKNKVDAINRDISIKTNFDILINMSDDMLFIKRGFDSIIVERMQETFPDYDGVLHFNDGGHYGSKLMTMSILGKKYYDRFGYIYFPGYQSVYCDNEAKEVAIKLGRYKYFNEILFNHNHPIWGKSKWDAQYRKTEDPVNYKADGDTFNIRKKNKFYLFEQ